MRVLNKHKGNVVGIEPGAHGDVDENNDGIKVFLSAGLLVDVSTIEPTPEREPTLEEAKKAVEELASRLADAREFIQSANERASALEARNAELEAKSAADQARAEKAEGDLDATAKLAAQLGKDLASREARIAELEAQLALKSEPAPADAPAPEAPVKKGRG